MRDQLAAERRALPWVQIEKEYVFDAPDGKVTLAQLFDGRSQLFIKHFMMGPGQVAQCVGCSLEVDNVEGSLIHLQNHDVSYVAIARASIQEIEAVRNRMGWRFRWVSSYNSDFNYDFNVSFTPEQIAEGRAFYNYEYGNPWVEDRSGDSVFFRDDAGCIFHTYSTFGRGGEEFLGTYRYSRRHRRGAMSTARTTPSATGCGRRTCTAAAAWWRRMGAITSRAAPARSTQIWRGSTREDSRLLRDRGPGSSGRDPRAVAEVSGMSGGRRRSLDRARALAHNRNVRPRAASVTLRRVVALPGCGAPAPLSWMILRGYARSWMPSTGPSRAGSSPL